jgi:hypothetical protein
MPITFVWQAGLPGRLLNSMIFLQLPLPVVPSWQQGVQSTRIYNGTGRKSIKFDAGDDRNSQESAACRRSIWLRRQAGRD